MAGKEREESMQRLETVQQNVDKIQEDNEDLLSTGSDYSEDDADDEKTASDGLDIFETHFANPDDAVLAKTIATVSQNQWRVQKFHAKSIGKVIAYIPSGGTGSQMSATKAIQGPQDLQLKSKLVASVKKMKSKFNDVEASIAPYIFDYQDVLFGGRTIHDSDGLRTLYCLHALNHIFKTRDRVIKNNGRRMRGDGDDDVELRDQGFTRPKVLVVVPTRHSCARIVDTIAGLCEPEQQENKKRFQDAYVETEGSLGADKPEDFRDLFSGNDDDLFRIGLKFTRKTIKYFARFYNSDIIIASPLGLRMAMGMDDEKKQDHDFLSSIEMVILDQADALLMQNWEHVECLFDHLNLQPKEARGCDFSRVRAWYLDDHAQYLRQTLVFSGYHTPELNSLFSSHMKNVAGKVKCSPQYDGSALLQPFTLKQVFSRFDCPSPAAEPDVRFKYFSAAILPSLLKVRHRPSPASSSTTRAPGILLFIPSSLDFIRVRNHLATTSLSFGVVSEYTAPPDVARARSHFLTGRHALLLYTERAHHFRRYRIRGVSRVVMYGLPDNPIFYREITGGYLERSVGEGRITAADTGVRCLFSRWDGLKLERIVGEQRAGAMIKGDKGDTFEFL
ncbi:MAG: rRNA-binding ribosome biosynthesis protein utp25 [Thelocarpon superellum]|nr:MAG: rRNA-binding ribosome biosynthesis protein utp25 [Thelocarpon superellum]